MIWPFRTIHSKITKGWLSLLKYLQHLRTLWSFEKISDEKQVQGKMHFFLYIFHFHLNTLENAVGISTWGAPLNEIWIKNHGFICEILVSIRNTNLWRWSLTIKIISFTKRQLSIMREYIILEEWEPIGLLSVRN